MQRGRLVLVAALLATAGMAQTDGVSATGQAPRPAAADGGRSVDGLEQAVGTNVQRSGERPRLHSGGGTAIYMVRFADPAVPSYHGGKAGLPATAPRSGQRLDPDGTIEQVYANYLDRAQREFVDRSERTVGRPLDALYNYRFAVNGMAVELTADEALQLASDPAVVAIHHELTREIHTDAGPAWIEADEIWNGTVDISLPGNQGAGIVIGTIDTGISPNNPSFADPSPGDGYDHTNPLGAGVYLGACNPSDPQYDAAVVCNDKLIGAYVFGAANEIDPDSAIDYDGHGSHTASTSGGGAVDGVIVNTPTGPQGPFDISGVAPHANVISYLGCCTESGLTMSIEQAIIDGVDVINYSIGSDAPSSNLWGDFDSLGFLNARAAGIFVATSNGNAGPGDATTGSPADAPWLTSVGASTHNRRNASALITMTSTGGPLGDISGKSLTSSLAATPIIDAGSVDDELCESTSGNEAAFTGKIVVCTRGVIGRVEKSANVAAQGAAGFVLANDEPNGDDITGDAFEVPGVAVTFDDGVLLKAWLANGSVDHMAAIDATTFLVNDTYGDIMAAFSSRGPNQVIDVVSPAVTAPGVDILAALTDTAVPGGGAVYGFSSGTSMAGPHVAGAGALLVATRSGWSPAQIQSALMTTAVTTVLNHDGQPATPYAQGSGRIDVARAVMAGLLFDESEADYLAANPADGGDPKTLNIPSFANSQCLSSCSWDRVATVPTSAPNDVTWTPSFVADAGLTLDITLSTVEVSPNDSMTISVDADVAGATAGEVLFGRITLTPSDPAVPSVTMPVAVVPSDSVLPSATDIQTRRDAGSQLLRDVQTSGVSEFTGSLAGWVQGDLTEGASTTDPTNDAVYDDLSQVDVIAVAVPAGTTRFITEVLQAAAPDLDLYVGTGTIPSPATEVCFSASGGSLEGCDLLEPAAGTYWILIQNWEGTGAADPDPYTLSTAVISGASEGNGSVVGPTGVVPIGEPFDVTATWDIPAMEVGDVWYSAAILGSSPATPGDIGLVPLRLERLEDDVVKTASVASAEPGATIDYEITVQPNVAKVDLEYTIVDTVPDGLVIDPASVSGGGVVDGQTITWTVPVATPVGAAGDYVLSTPDDSVQCAAGAGFENIAGVSALDTDMDGDSVSGSYFSSIGPFEFYGSAYPDLTVTEDGMMTVTDDVGAEPYIAQSIPDPTTANGVIAPLWSDLELSVADGVGMRFGADPDTDGGGADRVAVIQWDDPFEWTGGTLGDSVGQFQTWIYAEVSPDRPEMRFEYNSIGVLPATATVGVEDEAGLRASALLNAGDPAGALTAGGTLCLDYEGPTFDPVVLTYSVSVAADASGRVATNVVEHLTDDPFAVAAQATADVEVLAPGLTPSPTTVDFGDVVAGETSDPETVSVTNTGTDDLTVSEATTAAPFLLDASDCIGGTIAPAATCDLVVRFTPTDDQPATGEIGITSDAPGSPHVVTVLGNGLADAVTPVAPGRYWDTRNEPTFDGEFSDTGRLGARSTFAVQVAGRGDVPANAIGVVANLTVIAPSDLGFATLYPCSDEVPTASHVNYLTGEVLANNAVVPLNADGEVCVFTRSPADFALDVNGFLPFGSPLVGLVPTRYVDTRTAADTVTFDGLSQGDGRVAGGSVFEVQIAGRGDVPADASGVMINVTAVAPDEDGFLTVFPCGERPDASTANYFAGQVVPNGAVTSLSDAGTLCMFTRATTDLLLDVNGYVPAGASGLQTIVPARLLDTRPDEETIDGESNGVGRVAAEEFIEVRVAGRAGIPAGATAALFNIGVVSPDGPGYATLYPCGERPRTSNVNHVIGQTVRANNALTKLSDDGTVCIFVKSGTDLILDVTGWIG